MRFSFKRTKLLYAIVASIILLFFISSFISFGSRVKISNAVDPTLNKPDLSQQVASVPIDESVDASSLNELKSNNKLSSISSSSEGFQGDSTAGLKITSNILNNEIVPVGKCGKEHQFVIMIDAGSSGSRIHIYEFDICSQPPVLIKEVFEALKPGLSSFDADTEGAAMSLDPLLGKALAVIPDAAKKCTPVSVKATAGLRLLGEEKSQNILDAIRLRLTEKYPFPIVQNNGISIMGGDEEGVFAWITTNYLLGNIGNGEVRNPTSAIFDLGGGSTQIVFEPDLNINEEMVEGEHKYELTFGGEKYVLYQFSHLGYGLNQIREQINKLIVERAISKDIGIDKEKKLNLMSPCLAPGSELLDVKVQISTGDVFLVDFHSTEIPSAPQCRRLAEDILKKKLNCEIKPCSFNGVHQPSLVHTFKETNDMHIFSFFYDRTQSLGFSETFTLQELKDLSRNICQGKTAWEAMYQNSPGVIEELNSDPYYCLDLSYQVTLLQTGYDIPLLRTLKTAQKISDKEIGWCLGASLPLIESNTWQCRIDQTI
ncbi:hypothetical protein Kpol_370p8 [Vanderwaltozyma polyspora DSM 70294]|uniref:guanosine-diphosphatase n=1 Tax=Vanderwaltozyma polyspora (strain ATCC 22028 / DSM 70294 / BCRC 21397 / CBS 2163 / NBRC 10782 / NRRL Y-8283 / UCD 57-17) TaxID=436907 RepID=A7TSI1_VANPO|nr:uncharacterized protein Kpol_370p8 [Vanderwaltozyma polyspora DSM 70294]EDO14780.1 hypothetical protein Kpol_370p8 [Vanderwaltozyma polyspora DSM 70294]